MKIGIDVRCLIGGRRTGVEEYTINFLREVFSLDKSNKYILFLNNWQSPVVDLDWTKKYKNVEIRRFRWPNRLLNLSLWYLRWPKIDKLLGGVDVFFAPNINFIALSKQTKFILTIHDLSFERFPETFSVWKRVWHIFVGPKKLAQRADKIIAVSKSTANDLKNIYNIDSGKIKVVHSSVDKNFKLQNRNNPKFLEVKEKYKLPFNFVLYLGNIEPRKNIVALIEAYEKLNQQLMVVDRQKNIPKLVIAGGQGWKAEKIYQRINNSSQRKNIIMTGFIANEDKPFVYGLASLFVYPSFFEGFGFPPLEAMRSGVPVVATNNSSLPEIIGKGGVMIDADRPDEIALACRSILTDKKLKNKLVSIGLNQSQKFSWEKSAKKFLTIIEEL